MRAFEGDTFIPIEIANLKEKFKLTHCVETGTQYGYTTKWFCELFDFVITIEIDEANLNTAQANLRGAHCTFMFGESQDRLKDFSHYDNVLYYLDAHGNGKCPLKQELEVIASKKHKNVCIAIHDFKVPGKDFGYDVYDYELCFEEIAFELAGVYPDGYEYHYNEEANGARRGIIYVYPKK